MRTKAQSEDQTYWTKSTLKLQMRKELSKSIFSQKSMNLIVINSSKFSIILMTQKPAYSQANW